MQQPRNLIVIVVVIGALVGGFLIYNGSQSDDDSTSNEDESSSQSASVPTPTPDPETLVKIDAISDLHANDFTNFIRDNDTESLNDIYLHRNLPLRVTRKTRQGPYTSTDNISQWMGTVGRVPDYEIVVGQPLVFADGGVGVSVVEFNELNGEIQRGFGTQLFSFVNTPDGWKMVALTSVRTAAEDPTDYSQARDMVNNIETIMANFADSVNNQNRSQFVRPYVASTDPFIVVDDVFEAEFTVDEHSPGAFYDLQIAELSAPQLVLENVEVHVHDQYVAYATATYTLMDGDEVVLSGRWVSTFMATVTYGWQVTSTLLTAVG